MVLLWFNLSIVSILFYQHIKLQFKDKITFRMYFYFLKFSQKIPKLSVWSPQWFVKNNPRFYFEKKNSLDFYFEIERCTFNWNIYYFFLQNSIPKKNCVFIKFLSTDEGLWGTWYLSYDTGSINSVFSRDTKPDVNALLQQLYTLFPNLINYRKSTPTI